MSKAERPLGICFDYGRTLVEFTRPEAAIAKAGAGLAQELALDETSWRGTAAEFALELDRLVDEMVDTEQRADPWREVDFKTLHREAMRSLMGCRPDAETSDRVANALQRAWIQGVMPIESARRVVARLHEQGMPLGLCSNAPFPPHLMDEQLEHLGLRQYFDATLFSSEIGWRKPDPRIFAEMLDRLGLAAESVWFLGDEWEADIQGASAAGMRPILAPGASGLGSGVERLARWDDLLALLG